MRFQKREKSISGPKVAPKPAHANDVMPKIVLLASHAMNMEISVMATIEMRETSMICRSLASRLRMP